MIPKIETITAKPIAWMVVCPICTANMLVLLRSSGSLDIDSPCEHVKSTVGVGENVEVEMVEVEVENPEIEYHKMPRL